MSSALRGRAAGPSHVLFYVARWSPGGATPTEEPQLPTPGADIELPGDDLLPSDDPLTSNSGDSTTSAPSTTATTGR
ncbi:hypothetical protein OG911_13775 [Streptomyces sp. NBC_00208]|uniref:hypothetical protein n=1 Tax=Streptomyces sp. NBC_00208 TaxID=2975681 RepID=UPI002E2C64BC|nr:hypothetical protein [Streptomyces sp. NBC_00208]